MKKVKISKVKQVVVKSSDKVEKYLEFMEKMPGMLLDYVTHCNLPSRLKSMIAMHLSVGNDVSCLVKLKDRIVHGYQVSGSTAGSEVWIMPIWVGGKALLAVHLVDSNKMYIQDTPLQIREIAA